MAVSQRITPCLWFDDQAEEAAKFYTGIFRGSKITQVSHYGEAGREVHGRPVGSVMTVAFELDGQAFTALNGGPVFKFNEAISLMVHCDTQQEIDDYWDKLSADPAAEQCGWLKDRWGLSWQIVPGILAELQNDPDRERAARAMQCMMGQTKFVIAELVAAADGR